MKQDWQGKRVIILGAARQGLALARYLANHGARICLNDRRDSEEMADAIQSLADLDVTWRLGGHPLSLLDDCYLRLRHLNWSSGYVSMVSVDIDVGDGRPGHQ